MTLNIHGSLLARNTVFNLAGQGLPLVMAVITIPPIIRGLGVERFGIVTVVWVLLGYFSMFDLGLGRAATKFVAEALGRGEQERLPAIAWTAVIIQAMFGLLGGFVLGGITPLLVEHILNIPQDLVTEARLSLYVLAPSAPLVLMSGSLRGVLEAAQRFDLVNVVKAPLRAANFLLPLVGVCLGWDLPRIVALLVIAQGLALAVQYWLCIRVFPALNGLPLLHHVELRALVGFGGWVTVSSVVVPILVYLDRFAVGVLLTMAAVAYYSAPYEIAMRLWIIPASLVATVFPALSTLSEQGQWEQLETLVSRSVKYLLLVLGPMVIIIVAYAHQILRMWLGSEFAREGTSALQILAVGVLINSLASVPYSLVQALGRPDLTAKLHLAEVPLHGLLVGGLISMWGIPGAALAWSIRAIVDALLLFITACSLSSVSVHGFLIDKVPQTALLLLVIGWFVVGGPALRIATWLRPLVLLFVSLATALAIWQYSLNDRDRTEIVRLLRLVGGK